MGNEVPNMEKFKQQEGERQTIINTLVLAVKFFSDCNAEYRIIGSTLIAAHVGRVFRHIGDLDVLLDVKSKDCVFGKLKNVGFTLENKKKVGFHWVEAVKEGHLGLTFLLVGRFTEKYFSWRFLKVCELRVNSGYLEPTRYSFGTIDFVGIPLASVISGIRQSFLNPKRKIDRQILNGELHRTKPRTYGNIKVCIFGIKVPFLYDVFSFFYNVYGGMRVLFGRRYEIWD